LLTTALLKEVRASTSVGGGGRERRNATEELGKPPKRYAKGSPIPRVRSGLDLKASRKAGRRE